MNWFPDAAARHEGTTKRTADALRRPCRSWRFPGRDGRLHVLPVGPVLTDRQSTSLRERYRRCGSTGWNRFRVDWLNGELTKRRSGMAVDLASHLTPTCTHAPGTARGAVQQG